MTSADVFRFFEPVGGRSTLDALVDDGLDAFLSSETGAATHPDTMAGWFEESTLPERGRSADDYVRWLFEHVVPHSVRTHSPRFIGHMTSSLPSFVEPLGRIMTALNQNVVKLETSNAFTFYERQAIAMLHRQVFGLAPSFYAQHVQRRESTLGTLASGGTLANVAALWCARNKALGAKPGFDGVEQEGLSAALTAYGHRRAVVIGSSLMHYSFEKAVDLLGLGRRALLRVPANTDGTIRVDLAEKLLAQCRAEGDLVVALVGVAGTTETGAVDPLDALADLSAEHRTHLHVDAAWGGPVLFSRRHRDKLSGVARADSVTIDGHKQLYLPMGLGMALFRDPDLARSIETQARYIIRSGSPDLGRRTLEGSRPAMAIYLHGALHIIGRGGYEQLIDDGIDKCTYLAEAIERRPELELLASPTLNILVYRYIPAHLRGKALNAADNLEINRANERLQDAQREAGGSFISRTTLTNTRHGGDPPIVALRAVLANPLTTRADIDGVLDEQLRLGAALD